MEKTAFDRTVDALKQQGMNSDEILNELSLLFQELTKGENVVVRKLNKPIEESEEDSEKEYELRIKKLLHDLGISCKLSGYNILVQAIKLYSANSKQRIVKDLYGELVQMFDSKPSTMEKNIRYAIEFGMSNGPAKIYEENFVIKERRKRRYITNTEFIRRCVQILNE